MVQSSYTLPVKPNTDAQLNNVIPWIGGALQAAATLNVGSVDPASGANPNTGGTTYPCQFWADTANNLLKLRNTANTSWIVLGPLDTAGFILVSGSSPVGSVAAYFVGQLHLNTATKSISVATAANGTVGGTTWTAVGASSSTPKSVSAPFYASAATVTIPSGNSAVTAGGQTITLTSDRTISLAATGAGGREAGTTSESANTWYYPWLIGDSTGANTPHAVWSNSTSDISLPSGYDQKARLPGFAVRNDNSSNIIPFRVSGWPYAPFISYDASFESAGGVPAETMILDINGSGGAASWSDLTEVPKYVPPISQKAMVWVAGVGSSSTPSLFLRAKGGTGYKRWMTSANIYDGSTLIVDTNASQLMEYYVVPTSAFYDAAVFGWYG